MPPAPTAGFEPTDRVDDALRTWRTETVRRRNAWNIRHADDVAEQRARREQTYVFIGAASFSFLTTLATAAWAWSQWISTPVSVAPIAPTPVAIVETGGHISAPVRTPVTAASLGIQPDLHAWEANGTLWIQVDFIGDVGELRWFDAAGAEVLERTPCTIPIAGSKRCFVGRTGTRVQQALDAGATPGTWSAKLCSGDRCATVAKYAIEG